MTWEQDVETVREALDNCECPWVMQGTSLAALERLGSVLREVSELPEKWDRESLGKEWDGYVEGKKDQLDLCAQELRKTLEPGTTDASV